MEQKFNSENFDKLDYKIEKEKENYKLELFYTSKINTDKGVDLELRSLVKCTFEPNGVLIKIELTSKSGSGRLITFTTINSDLSSKYGIFQGGIEVEKGGKRSRVSTVRIYLSVDELEYKLSSTIKFMNNYFQGIGEDIPYLRIHRATPQFFITQDGGYVG